MNLQELLIYLENHIDPEHQERTEQLHIDAMDFKPVSHLPLAVYYPIDSRITPYPYSESVADMRKMMYNELAGLGTNVLNSVEIRDEYPLQIRANYGIGVICSLFGLKSVVKMENMPWVTHLESIDALRPIVDRGVPKLDEGLGRTVRQCCEFYREMLEPYEKCARYIHITQPDLQGPFDILHLMLGNELFYALYDEPELMHDALKLISETYIAYHKFITPYTTALVDGGKKCVVHRAIYGGTAVIKDDTATATLSEEMYAEFVAPYNSRVLRALAPSNEPHIGSVHFCGARKKWHYPQMIAQPLNCLNFGNPEMHDFEHVYPQLQNEKISVVGFGQENDYGFVQKMLDAGVKTGVSLLIQANSREEARDILRNHQS